MKAFLIYVMIAAATVAGTIGFIAFTRSDLKLPTIEVPSWMFDPSDIRSPLSPVYTNP